MNELESRLTNGEISPFELETQDEDYDIYLFWPSLNSGTATFEKPSVATHQRHLSPLFDPVDSYAGWDTAPSSPLSFAPPSDFRFHAPLEDDYAIDSEASKVQGNGVREKDPLPRYSSMFKMGLLLTRAAQHVDRAVQNVGDKLRNAKATRRSTYTFGP